MEITKDTTMGELLSYDWGISQVLLMNGMHCVGCPSHAMESIEMGCQVHGIDVNKLLADINEYLANKKA
ncbi:MAG: DUF1858 domain-containing protein [Clostridia bacterium]|nr:DUF1858 domain-containing protein [Clostridia bacterium]